MHTISSLSCFFFFFFFFEMVFLVLLSSTYVDHKMMINTAALDLSYNYCQVVQMLSGGSKYPNNHSEVTIFLHNFTSQQKNIQNVLPYSSYYKCENIPIYGL